METGIPPDVWAEQGERAIVTAFDLLNKGVRRDSSGRQMSG